MPTITDSIGRVLAGRYRVESALGTGASAHVYAAWDITLRRRVAIKMLHPALAEDGSFLRRFRAEAQASASLAHPHVLAVFDWGQDEGGGPFVVLEHLGGGSLRDLLDADRRLSVPQAVAIGLEAAEGLAYAHARGFIHRDVKPANLLFDEDGRIRVADFGLARALAEAAWTEPAGALLGTARYVAPEQAEGKAVDGRTDVYALALVLYEAVTGIVPFSGDSTVAMVMARVGSPLPGHDALGSLSGLLTEAAAPHIEERLDAADFARRLAELALTLPAPERLVLVGPSGRGIAPREAPPADMTVLGRRPEANGVVATEVGAEASGGITDVLAFAEAVGVADAATSAGDSSARRNGPAPRGSSSGRHSRQQATKGDHGDAKRPRSWRRLLVVSAVILVLAAAALFVVQTKVFTPSHRVPSILGLTVARADSALHADHLAVSVIDRRAKVGTVAGDILTQVPSAGASMKEGTTVSVVLSSGPPPVTVPALAAVTGGCPAVASLLLAANLVGACTSNSSISVPEGQVISSSPTGSAPYGSTITVSVSSGLPSEAIPSLDGMTCQGATTALAAAHLQAQCAQAYSTTGVAVGDVSGWSPQSAAPYNSTVSVTISEGPPPVTVPNLLHDRVDQAQTALQNAGLVLGSIYGPGPGRVFQSDPAMGQSVPAGTQVNIYTQ